MFFLFQILLEFLKKVFTRFDMADKRRDQILLWITIFTLIVSVVTISRFSGYHHAPGKFKIMLITLSLVLLLHFVFIDPIKFVLQAIAAACWPQIESKFPTEKEATRHNRLCYLKLRLQSLRSHFWITEEHRDERVNSRLKLISTDLIGYGKYFLMVTYIMLIYRNVHENFVARNIRQLLHENGLKDVRYICDVYDFIQRSFIDAFSPDPDRQNLVEWVHGEQTVMVGVLRLRQLRLTKRHYGVENAAFSNEKYLPEWKLPYSQEEYMENYWRIYQPWLPMEKDSFQIPLIDSNSGFYRRYPDLEGYVTYLARTRQNSQTILNFLREKRWLDYNTSVLFLDFSLYNADTNVFIICTIRLEQTPFGSIIPDVNVVSIQQLESLKNMNTFRLVLLLIYVFVFIQFYKALILKLWFDPHQIHDTWNKVDIIIFFLNVLFLILFLIRKSMIESILKEIETESKMRYIDVRYLIKIQSFFRLIMGLLIALSTIRLCKVLQFLPTFQLLTHTLLISWRSVVNMVIAIWIIIVGYALPVSIINGNNNFNFNPLRSPIANKCYTFGSNTCEVPHDLFNGFEIFGIILSLLISVLLLNIIVSLINNNFTNAKAQQESRMENTNSIFQFWRQEYHFVYQFSQKHRIFRKIYNSRNKTVTENIDYEMTNLEKIQRRSEVNHLFIKRGITKAESQTEYSKFKKEMEQIYRIGAIMNAQIDILDFYLHSDKHGNQLETKNE